MDARRWLDRLSWKYTTGHFRAFEHDFAVRTTDAALGGYLDRVFSPFAVSGERKHFYSVFTSGTHPEWTHSVFWDGECLAASRVPSFVLSILLWHVNRQALESCDRYLLIHAAAAEYGGQALLFPAPMESGKTTLVAGLVRAGLRYLTDEAAAIEPQSLHVHPFPKALSIKPGSWNVLADLEPVVQREIRPYLTRQWHVDPRAIRHDCLAPPSSPRFVILPLYRKGSCTELIPLRPAQALLALCENAFNLNHYHCVGLEALAAIVRQSKSYRLTIGDLTAACRLVLRLLSTT